MLIRQVQLERDTSVGRDETCPAQSFRHYSQFDGYRL